jgi:hypothetical protein
MRFKLGHGNRSLKIVLVEGCSLLYPKHIESQFSGANSLPAFGETTQSIYDGPRIYLLYDNGAELVLNGHDHDYERFARQNPSGGLDEARGLQEFVIGTGGVAEQPFATVRANSLVRNDNTWGTLELTLHPTSYDFRFIPASIGSFSDLGSSMCH